MLRLQLFGAPSLSRDGVLLGGRAAQRHRLALLALLALAPGRRLGRDRLIAWLWPESAPDQGRNLLKVASYVLRSAVGENALLSVGDELRLDTDAIEVDVAEFETALEQGDHGRAVALHAAPFMDGFFLPSAPEFEHWLEGERRRLRGGYGRALEALAGKAEESRDYMRAAEWWKVRAADDPYDSRVALRLMEALEGAGNRAGALQHAAIHQRLLQSEFGVDAPAEVSTLAERLRREPIVAADVVTRRPDAAPPAPDRNDPAPERPSAAPDDVLPSVPSVPPAAAAVPPPDPVLSPAAAAVPKRPWHRAAAATLVTLLVVAVGLWSVRPPATEGGLPARKSIVVLPFVNMSADREQEYFSDGLTEEIIARLAAIPDLHVISRTSAMFYKGSRMTLPQIARELRVDHILEGSVRREDGRLRITAQLIDARSDGHLWAESYEYEMRNSFQIQEAIARSVAQELEVKLGDRTRRLLARRGTDDTSAYNLYRQGRHQWNTRTVEGHQRALAYFEQAIARDPAYADAYAGIADVHLTLFQLGLTSGSEDETYSRIKWAAERALALDDESADAHTSFAIALWWQRNWPGAARELRRALDLNPGHATAHSWLSLLLCGMGQGDEALRESRLAWELDPFSVVTASNYGWQCYLAREYGCAAAQFGRTLEIGPFAAAHRGLGLVYAQEGRAEEAVAAVRRAVELAPQRSDFLADLAYVLAVAGRNAEARRTLEQAKERPLEAFNVARAHVALGERDSAFVWLERSNWRWPHRATVSDPALDPLRADPRLARLTARVEREMGIR